MKKNILYIAFLLCNFLFVFQGNSQTADSSFLFPSGIPISFNHEDLFTEDYRAALVTNNLPSQNNTTLKAYADSIEESCSTCEAPSFYGAGIRNTINFKNSAQYYNSNIDGGKLWILKISSATAFGLQFYFSKFILPDESFMHIYSEDKSSVLGPFSSTNNPTDTNRLIQFGTLPLNGDVVYLEYFESDSASFSGTIIIDNVIHIFDQSLGGTTQQFRGLGLDLSGSAPCQKDAVCFSGWEPEINSTAIILRYDDTYGLSGICTGALVNNTNENSEPYFLTAAHCLTSSAFGYDEHSWQFVFDYESFDCLPHGTQSMPFYTQTVYGANRLAVDDLGNDAGVIYGLNSDYALLYLNVFPSQLQNMGVCFAGWSISLPFLPYANQHTLIHHPKGDLKKISQGNNLNASITTSRYNSANYYTMDINVGGMVQKGTSGSPLFNQSHKIIGTATAYGTYTIANPCVPSTYNSLFFGRFAKHWTFGGLSFWLDPANLTFQPSYDGPSTYCPNPANQVLGGPTLNSYQFLNEGFEINGKSQAFGIPTLCSTEADNLTITPAVGNKFRIYGYNKRSKCSSVYNYSGLPTGCRQVTFLAIPTGKCDCSYYSYVVYITELDYNLNPINTYSKVFEYHTSTTGNHSRNDFYFYVPDILGHSFVPGKFYNVGVSNLASGTWHYSSQNVYVLPNAVSISNASNVVSNIYSSNEITINNSSISNPVLFVATNSITILPNTLLDGGEYFIEYIDCNSFRMAEVHNSNNLYTNATYNYEELNQSNLKTEKKESLFTTQTNDATVFPNPSEGVFQIQVTKNNEPIGIKEIKVFDIVGKIIWSTGENSNNIFIIDISNYSKGIYYVRTVNKLNEIAIEKITKK